MFYPPKLTQRRGTGLSPGGQFYGSDPLTILGGHHAIGPQAVYDSGQDRTYIAWQMIGNSGNKGIHICYYDHATGTWSDRYRVGNFNLANDDHGQPALAIDGSGYIHCYYGSHASVQKYSVTTSPNDITEWTQMTDLSGNVTYPKPVVVSTNMYVFHRDDSDIPSGIRPMQVRSGAISSGAASLGAKTVILTFDSDSRVYHGTVHKVGTDLHFVATRSNSSDTARKGVYYFRYNTSTGALTNFDASFSVASGSLPMTLTQANTNCRIYDHGSDDGEIPALEFDSSGDAHVVFAVGQSGSNPVYELKHMYLSGGTWSSPVTVARFTDEEVASGYVNAFALVPLGGGKMELWTNNARRDVVRYTMSSSKVWDGGVIILRSRGYQYEGLTTVRSSDADLRVIMAETIRPALDASAALLRMFCYGDGGPITSVVDQTVLDSSIASVPLLLGMNHRDGATTMVDESPFCRPTPTFSGNAQIDTAQKKFGSASLLLDGTGDYVSFPDSADFRVTQTNFTFECWVRSNEDGRLQCIVSKRGSPAREYAFYKNASNVLQLVVFDSSAATVINISGTTSVTTGAWHHVAFSKAGTAWKIFLNGVQEGSATQSGTPEPNALEYILGRDASNTARDWNGWIDEVRHTLTARYTSGFTAPSAAFPRR